jgi:hypothetical protein
MVFDGQPPIFVFSMTSKFAAAVAAISEKLPQYLVLLTGSLLVCSALNAENLYQIEASVKEDTCHRVRSIVQVSGSLKLNPDGKRVVRLPLKVQGELLYDERVLNFDAPGGLRKDIRLYHKADAAIRVGDGNHKTTLSDSHRIVVAEVSAGKQVLFSPLGPFTLDELELIDIQGSSTLLFRLLPSEEVGVGDHWQHTDEVLRSLFGLEAITHNDLQSNLRQVEGSVAIIDLEGSVSGAIRGIASDLEIQGKYNFDLEHNRITWLALEVTENRAVGHAEPGFEATARIRTAIAPGAKCPELSSAAIKGFPLDGGGGATLLRFPVSHGAFQFLHDRSWRVMTDRHDVAILRRIEEGDLVAQCNTSPLAKLKEGQRVQLEAFKADIQRSLGKEFGQFIEASEEKNGNGLPVLRVVASGTASDVPIQWNYYLLSDDAGRQAAIVFTLDARMAERFAAADRTIVSSFEFLDASDTASLDTARMQPNDRSQTR